jgi:hypothetical protein
MSTFNDKKSTKGFSRVGDAILNDCFKRFFLKGRFKGLFLNGYLTQVKPVS